MREKFDIQGNFIKEVIENSYDRKEAFNDEKTLVSCYNHYYINICYSLPLHLFLVNFSYINEDIPHRGIHQLLSLTVHKNSTEIENPNTSHLVSICNKDIDCNKPSSSVKNLLNKVLKKVDSGPYRPIEQSVVEDAWYCVSNLIKDLDDALNLSLNSTLLQDVDD